MNRRCRELGDLQPSYWPKYPGVFQFQGRQGYHKSYKKTPRRIVSWSIISHRIRFIVDLLATKVWVLEIDSFPSTFNGPIPRLIDWLWCRATKRYSVFVLIARRHGHVFRMALHNEGDWRIETWQRARRASCHVSIRQSPSCVMPFWTHAKCLLAFISYLPMWLKAKYTFIKTVCSPRIYGGPYMQAKHADVCSGVLFWTVCTRRQHVLSLPSRCEKSDSWRQTGSVKSAKKSRTVPQCGHVTLNCVQMASKQAKVEFSSHIFQFTRLHGVAVMQRLTFWDSVVTLFKSASQVVRTVRHWITCCAPTIGNVMRKCKIGKSSPHQPCENTCHSNVLELSSLLWMARALACF